MMIVAMVACAVCLVMALIRTALGPTAFDRVLAVNAIGTIMILGISLHGFIMERPEFVDIAFTCSSISLMDCKKVFSASLGSYLPFASCNKRVIKPVSPQHFIISIT